MPGSKDGILYFIRPDWPRLASAWVSSEGVCVCDGRGGGGGGGGGGVHGVRTQGGGHSGTEWLLTAKRLCRLTSKSRGCQLL